MQLREQLERAQLLDFYRQMVLIREFEEESARQYMLGKIKGFLHLYIGEEAVAVGSISALRPQDYVVTHYRDHGHALARGLDPKAVMAELFGKATGCSRGKGGSMHLVDASKNFMGGYAIVGGQLPVAVGLALACQYRGEDRLALVYMGDGALQEGEFHECMNLASVWKLPVIFFCENNLYGMGARVKDTFALHDQIYRTAEAYRMPGVRVDGMDLLAVREATLEAVRHVAGGNGPYFIEAITYRFRGHSMADPASYRSREEVQEWEQRDPIVRYRKWLLEQGLATPEELESIDRDVVAGVEEAVRFAEESPWPPPEALYEDVYGK